MGAETAYESKLSLAQIPTDRPVLSVHSRDNLTAHWACRSIWIMVVGSRGSVRRFYLLCPLLIRMTHEQRERVP